MADYCKRIRLKEGNSIGYDAGHPDVAHTGNVLQESFSDALSDHLSSLGPTTQARVLKLGTHHMCYSCPAGTTVMLQPDQKTVLGRFGNQQTKPIKMLLKPVKLIGLVHRQAGAALMLKRLNNRCNGYGGNITSRLITDTGFPGNT